MRVEKANAYILLKAKVRKTNICCYPPLSSVKLRTAGVPSSEWRSVDCSTDSSLIFISGEIVFFASGKPKCYRPLYFTAECLTKVICDSSPDLSHSFCSTAVVFYVQNGHPSMVIKASDVSRTLHVQLLKQKADFLLFKVLRVDTAGMFWIVLAHHRTLQTFG